MILLLLQQAAWWICALAAGSGHPGAALAVVICFCLGHAVTASDWRREMHLMVLAAAIGIAGDGLLVRTGAIAFPGHAQLGPMPAPLWMAALWGAFAALLTGPLAWLGGRPALAAFLGAVAGPLAYRGGEAMSGIQVAGTPGALAIALLYALATPTLVTAAGAPRSWVDRLLDASIVFSFDRTGFARHARKFEGGDPEPVRSGRVIVVTGASTGLGLASAQRLAALGFRVRLVCRDAVRGAGAMRLIRESVPQADLALDLVDVSDLEAVNRYAGVLDEEALDGLVHNAGLLPHERRLSAQGLETTFATHVAGPWLLTHLLEERLRRRPGSRVIFVSSGGMYSVKLSLDDLDWSQRPYDGVHAYAMTKRMQVVIAAELARRLVPGVHVYSMHPGWADTAAVRTALPGFWRLTRRILRSPDQGADTIVWLAATGVPPAGGGFWFDRHEVPAHLTSRTRESDEDRTALVDLLGRVTGGVR